VRQKEGARARERKRVRYCPIFPQKSHVFPQKSHIFPPKSPTHAHAQESARTQMSERAKEPKSQRQSVFFLGPHSFFLSKTEEQYLESRALLREYVALLRECVALLQDNRAFLRNHGAHIYTLLLFMSHVPYS